MSREGQTVEEAGAELIYDGLPADLAKYGGIAVQMGTLAKETVVLELRFTDAAASRVTWRRIDLEPGQAADVVLPFSAFRRSGASTRPGQWKTATQVRLRCRAKSGELRLDNLRLLPRAGAAPWIEPAESVRKRMGSGLVRLKETPRVRIFTNCAELDLDALAAEVDAFWKLFVEKMGAPDAAPEAPATLVVFEKEADYRKFAVESARSRYAAIVEEPRSGGFTFERMSVSSCDGASHRIRPVFLRELAHQWAVESLDLSATGGWIHEGVCAYLQTRRFPGEHLARDVKAILKAGRLRPASEFTAAFIPSTAFDQFQSMLLVQYFVEGPRKDRRAAAFSALADGASLGGIVEKTLGATVETFESEFRSFCAEQYP